MSYSDYTNSGYSTNTYIVQASTYYTRKWLLVNISDYEYTTKGNSKRIFIFFSAIFLQLISQCIVKRTLYCVLRICSTKITFGYNGTGCCNSSEPEKIVIWLQMMGAPQVIVPVVSERQWKFYLEESTCRYGSSLSSRLVLS